MPHSTLPICEANSGCSKSENTTGRTIYIINTISVAIFSSNATGRVEFWIYIVANYININGCSDSVAAIR
jgi:hypothetical protein